jgi:tetratricopeptide (TPR) repeat protein
MNASWIQSRRLALAMACAGIVASMFLSRTDAASDDTWDPLLSGNGRACGPVPNLQPTLLKAIVVAKSETAPFQPVPPKPALGEAPVLYKDLGALGLRIGTKDANVQAWFDQGLRLSFAFNHAEAQRAFREAQKLDPQCAMCFWGEALVLGPNINVPMMPEAVAPALAAATRAMALSKSANAKDRALIEALATRYAADPAADRAKLDGDYADAMKVVAKRFPADDTIQALFAEAAMDVQPWDYWEAAGTRPKGRAQDILDALETVLKRNPRHPGAIHLYIHTVEASTKPERALPYADRLGALMPGAGHIVHMPAHIYYRVGMYRESLAVNKRALEADEHYFASSPSDPLYRFAYYPHNIHFVMVSAQMGGDAATAIDAAMKLDAAMPVDIVKQFPIMQPMKAASYSAHAQFSDPDTILKLADPGDDLVLVKAQYHYARAIAFAGKKDGAGAQREIDALAKLEANADFKALVDWQVPAKEIVQTAKLVAMGRLADASGDLAFAARAYEDAIFIEDTLVYMEPPYWYYPVRQSLGGVRLRQGRLDEAEKAFREALARARGNGWALAGLVEVYKRKGSARSEKAARAAYAKAWFGSTAPAIERL